MGRDRILKRYLRTRFLITMKSGAAWSAVVMEIDDHSLLLSDTKAVNRDGTETPADGQVFLPRADVAHMQRA